MIHPPKNIKPHIINWLEAIWCTDLPAPSKLLAAYLRSFMNEKQDMAFPSVERICYETSQTKNTITKHLRLLESEGWLEVDRTVGGSGRCNRYVAVLPSGAIDLAAKRFTSRTVQEVNGSFNDKNGSSPDKNSSPSELEYTKNIQTINNTSKTQLFDEFWSVYPKRVGKAAAEKAWKRIKPSADTVRIIKANISSRLQCKDWRIEEKQFIPNPATYLNGRRWEDEVGEQKQKAGGYI